ncbi:SMI1/KNR4 family protein [Nocardiopsis rhodophaea]|uniref:SMI1/KNR4 family protein n=1 Tax=Nocardiopsis rhodophaea TaxID=280238 RepID=UPI0031D3B5E1
MTETSVSRLISEFLEAGLIEENEDSLVRGGGRPSASGKYENIELCPSSYIEYLERMEHFRGPYFVPVAMSWAVQEDASETAEDLSREYPDFTTSSKFFFSEHQGYIVWYFKKNDPGVYRFGEDTEREELLASSFEEFLNKMLNYAVCERRRSRDAKKRMHERNKRRSSGG